MSSHHADIIIIGAGISGLAAGYYGQKKGLTPLILESTGRTGGVIHSERTQGYLIEHGPNTVQAQPGLLDLIEDLSLGSQLQWADAKAPRFIQHRGQLYPLPMSPPAFFKSTLISAAGKLRLLTEPLRRRNLSSQESLKTFCERRLGPEVTQKIVAPFVSGVWAGDINKLSATGAFPKLKAWEKQYGSLFKGMLKDKPKQASPRGLISFRNGLSTLPQALGKRLKESIHLSEMVIDVKPAGTHWQVQTNQQTYTSPQLIFTTPAAVTAQLVEDWAPEAAQALRRIPYAPLAVLHLSYGARDIGQPTDGFGYLVCPSEQSAILGCLWSSSLFPDRTPLGKKLFTVFMGGATAPERVIQSDLDLLNDATQALEPILKTNNKPQLISIYRYKSAIPQYNQEYMEDLKNLSEAEDKWAGLHFGGNIKGGVAVGQVIESAQELVLKISH